MFHSTHVRIDVHEGAGNLHKCECPVIGTNVGKTQRARRFQGEAPTPDETSDRQAGAKHTHKPVHDRCHRALFFVRYVSYSLNTKDAFVVNAQVIWKLFILVGD